MVKKIKKILLGGLCVTALQGELYSSDLAKAGDIVQILIPATAYGTTLYLGDKEGQYAFYKSFATNLAVTYALKYSINRTRPNGGDHSFPSGHTSASFQGAAFIHKRYGWQYALGAYVAAAFVGYTRVESKAHYVSDVLAGAAIGTLSSFYFTKRYKGVSVEPQVREDGLNIYLTYRY